jgi:metallo-beta-lactamase family protein
MSIQIRFFGAAGEVTGSCHLLEVDQLSILLDCGQIQGGREEDRRNTEPFAFDPAEMEALVLSHAHIDHCGRLPLLVKRGFRGPIHATPATIMLVRVMLEDALKLMLADVERRNRQARREGGKLSEPLYEPEDVERVFSLLVAHHYGEEFAITPAARFRFSDAGHILGAAIVEAWLSDGKRQAKVIFSGDIGPKGTPIIRDPTQVKDADVVLMESTYGDRLHRERLSTVHEIGELLDDAHRAGGNVLIPAFAVGRSQELLYWFAKHFNDWNMKRFDIYLDSPMASKVIEAYKAHKHLFDDEAARDFKRVDPFNMPNLTLVSRGEDSRKLNDVMGGAIIIAGSGMCNGGRIVHHLKHHLWRASTHVLIPGFQAANTLGRQLVDGKKTVRIFGQPVAVNARVHTVGGLSAHADQAGLLEWFGAIGGKPHAYLVHGEDKAREVLAEKMRAQFGVKVSLARPGMQHRFP